MTYAAQTEQRSQQGAVGAPVAVRHSLHMEDREPGADCNSLADLASRPADRPMDWPNSGAF